MAEPISSKPKIKDRFWWLPVPLFFVFPFLYKFPSQLYDWLYPPPPANSDELEQIFCHLVTFMISSPGRLALCAFLSAPAMIVIVRRTITKKSWASLPLAAYLFTVITGLVGTIRLIPYRLYTDTSGGGMYGSVGETHLGIIPADGILSNIFLVIAAIGSLLALLVLIIGYSRKQIRLSSVLLSVLTFILWFCTAYIVVALAGAGNTCSGDTPVSPIVHALK